MAKTAIQALRRLEALRLVFSSVSGMEKIALLRSIHRSRLSSLPTVVRLHEQLCFMRAYPDDRALLAQVVSMLEGFERRGDVRQHVASLEDSGIAGTRIRYRFYWATLHRLAAWWPERLFIDWDALEDCANLAAALPLLATSNEAVWLRQGAASEHPHFARTAIATMNGKTRPDGTFLARRIQAMAGDDFTREVFADALDTPMYIEPGADTPSRTKACHAVSPPYFFTQALRHGRPDVVTELDRPPRSIRLTSEKEGEAILKLATGALVTRSRDIDGIAYGNTKDIWMVDDGAGLFWAFIGLVPERRQVLRASHGFVTLRNGVPIGYGQMDTLFGCADVSFNSFDTFRGAETAWIFVRLLAATRALLGARAFTLDGYQLGHHNEEAIASGAWWFYYKLGFRPRSAAIRQLAAREAERAKTQKDYRSSSVMLRRLAADEMVFETKGVHAPHWPRLGILGEKVARLLACHPSGDRQAALHELTRASMKMLGKPRQSVISANRPEVLQVMQNWAPILKLIGAQSWSRAEKTALGRLIAAKAGASEREFLALFDAHPRLSTALRAQMRA
ncbi:MAG: hypothetical protein ACKVQK_08760 [Burkholderiales bacterium]